MTTDSSPIPLWTNGAPGTLGDRPQDRPDLTLHRPARPNGTSLLILPGGGYWTLAPHEGEGYARWFAAQGITCHVLKYRLGADGYRHPCMLWDAARALRMVRRHARDNGLDPARVGIIGSSAGGHLASTLLTQFDAGRPDADDPVERESSRPDFGILCYPVISGVSFPHQGSFQNLLGENPSEEGLRELSGELNVTQTTPPTFLWHTADDPVVPMQNSLLFAGALRDAGVPCELHVYQHGPHGLGLPVTNAEAPPWDAACLHWLKQRDLLPSA